MDAVLNSNLDIDSILDKIEFFIKKYYHAEIPKENLRVESFKKENDITKVTVAFRLKEENTENSGQLLNSQQFINLKDQTELKIKTFEIIDNSIISFYDYQIN